MLSPLFSNKNHPESYVAFGVIFMDTLVLPF